MPAQIKLTQQRGRTLIDLAVAALIIAALYLGREIFVPVALAVLLSFVLAPLVIRMQSWRICVLEMACWSRLAGWFVPDHDRWK
jgi:predicted PurR-regulated permease PerM